MLYNHFAGGHFLQLAEAPHFQVAGLAVLLACKPMYGCLLCLHLLARSALVLRTLSALGAVLVA